MGSGFFGFDRRWVLVSEFLVLTRGVVFFLRERVGFNEEEFRVQEGYWVFFFFFLSSGDGDRWALSRFW